EAREAAARAYRERIDYRARAGLDAAAERAEQFERRFLRHLDRVVLARERVARERRLREEMIVQRLAGCVAEGRLSVGIGTAEVQREELPAIRAVTADARRAVAARA